MIKLSAIDNSVESCNQIQNRGVDSHIQSIEDYPLAEDVIESSESLEKQLTVFNIKLEGEKGEALIKQIQDKHSKVCIFLSTEACEFLNNDKHLPGVNWVVLKNNLVTSQVNGLTLIINDGELIDPKAEKRILKFIAKTLSISTDDITLLTDREIEIMDLLSRGLLYKEIAKKLEISIQTVKSHLKHIYPKLRVCNRTEAILRFLQNA